MHPNVSRPLSRRGFTLVLGALAGAAALAASLPAGAHSDAQQIPPYAGSVPAPGAGTETAVLAGGCFWGVQGVYQHVKGVLNAVSGYAGGDAKSAAYEIVSSGLTGHAESVQVTYDPRQVSYAQILQVFFSVAHDPTQLNRQGPDHGPQYRSAIFPQSPEQAQIAQAYIAQLDKAKVWTAPIVTKIEPGKAFYPAEGYHQDFLVRNPTYPYIVWNDLPKIEDLKRLFPAAYRADPVLVAQAKKSG
jgi:peptide-methionine (S)-S-oxide reductase